MRSLLNFLTYCDVPTATGQVVIYQSRDDVNGSLAESRPALSELGLTAALLPTNTLGAEPTIVEVDLGNG